MNQPLAIHPSEKPKRFIWRALILLIGLILPQFWLFGSALTGSKVLLPLDCLSLGDGFLPQRPEYAEVKARDNLLIDLVYAAEPNRLKLGRSLRQGHLSLTTPYAYCGGADPMSGIWFMRAYVAALFLSPVAIAWFQLAIALVAGIGMCWLLRSAFGIGFWAACVVVWCYPLTGFFMIWQGYGLDWELSLFPWMLLCVWKIATSVSVRYFLLLIAVTFQAAARLDMLGQELIAAGLWGAWLLVTAGDKFRRDWWWRGGTILAAWALALALAAPFILPAMAYTKTGNRTNARASGIEERPPVGLSALPQLIAPQCSGFKIAGRTILRTEEKPLAVSEGGAAGYAGLIAALALFPLAWSSRTHRLHLVLLSGLIILSTSWLLNLPGFVWVWRSHLLNLMSHNRFVFVFCTAILISAAMSLDRLFRRKPVSLMALCISILLLAVFAGWTLNRAWQLPQQTQALLQTAIERHDELANADQWLAAERKLEIADFGAVGLCVCAIAGLGVIAWRPKASIYVAVALAMLQGVELLSYASSLRQTYDWNLYYPLVAGIKNLAADTNSRALGVNCLPPRLEEMYGMRDIRGYDAVDPIILVNLLETARDPASLSPQYAVTQKYFPKMWIENGELRMPPAMQLLSVRYLIFRHPFEDSGELTPLFAGEGFWVYENKRALPRAFVPGEVRQCPDDQTLRLLSDKAFDPAHSAIASRAVDLPSNIRGTAHIVDESPNHILLSAQMQTAGLVVLSDLWDAGWHAKVNGQPAEVLRVDYGVRGVVVPAGRSSIEMTYFPRSLLQGLIICVTAFVLTGVGSLMIVRYARQTCSERLADSAAGSD